MSCFVPKCLKNRTSSEKLHTFRAPKDPELLRAWQDAIGRTDKKLKPDYRICHKHFEEDDILKYHILIINGKRVEEPRFRWDLREGAIPRLFLNWKEMTKNNKLNKKSRVNSIIPMVSEIGQKLPVLESQNDGIVQLIGETFTNTFVNEENCSIDDKMFEQTPISTNENDGIAQFMVEKFNTNTVVTGGSNIIEGLLEKPTILENLLIPKTEPVDDGSLSPILEVENSHIKEELMELDPVSAFDTLANNYRNLNLPRGWSIFCLEGNERNICISTFYKTANGSWLTLKQLVLDESMNMKFYVRDKIPLNITEFVPMYESPGEKLQNFQEILMAFDRILICRGAARSEQYPSISFMKTGSIKNNIWFSNQCKVILPQTYVKDTLKRLCVSCRKFLTCLYKRKERLRKNSDPKTIARTKEEIIEMLKKSTEEKERLKLKNLQYTNKIESLKVELDILREELEVEMEDNL